MHGTKMANKLSNNSYKASARGMAAEHVLVGPWGGTGGSPYRFTIPDDAKLVKIYIQTGGRGGCIDSIRFGYVLPSNIDQEIQSPRFGGGGGHLSQQMYLAPGEDITELGGIVGTYSGFTVITSLTFKTNRRTSEFGDPNSRGEKFSLPLTTTKIVGFHGRHGLYLDSIGAILAPK